MKIAAIICYSLLACQSGFILWLLWQIRSNGSLTVVEPNAVILNTEIIITGFVVLVAMAMFIKERLSS